MKAFVFIFIVVSFFGATRVGAQEKVVLSTEEKRVLKPEIFSIKKKDPVELKTTITQLEAVIERTQNALDLLSKKGKSTEDAQKALTSASETITKGKEDLQAITEITSLPEMTTEQKEEVKTLTKKVQEAIKETKGLLKESISSLKELLS